MQNKLTISGRGRIMKSTKNYAFYAKRGTMTALYAGHKKMGMAQATAVCGVCRRLKCNLSGRR